MLASYLCGRHARCSNARVKGTKLPSPLCALPAPGPPRMEASPGPFASLAWALDEGDGPAQLGGRPSLGLNKKNHQP